MSTFVEIGTVGLEIWMIEFLNVVNEFSLFLNHFLFEHDEALYPRIICGKVGCNWPINPKKMRI